MKNIILVILIIFSVQTLSAQVMKKEIIRTNDKGKPKAFKFSETKISSEPQSIKIFMRSVYDLEEAVELREMPKKNKLLRKSEVIRFQQFYKGIRVEFAEITSLSRGGEVVFINGAPVDLRNFDTTPAFSRTDAIKYALDHTDASKYLWENVDSESLLKQDMNDPNATYYPKPELVIIESNLLDKMGQYFLAYHMVINAEEPFSSNVLYIDAKTGDVVRKGSLIRTFVAPSAPLEKAEPFETKKTSKVTPLEMGVRKFALGTAATRYSGTQFTHTSPLGGNHILKDLTRGADIYTQDLRLRGANYGLALEITDSDNNWTAAEYNNSLDEDVALDVHWGMQMAYDYFKNEHNWNSFDNNGYQIRAFAHADGPAFGVGSNDNAWWWNSRLHFGDGWTQFGPMVSLDIVAHEYAHGLYNFEMDPGQNMPLSGESGAISEGLSDIWAMLIEFYTSPNDPNKSTYEMGEEVILPSNNDPNIRSLEDPHSRNFPDTYGDVNGFWDNSGLLGVHHNSTVLGYWFFLLAEGGSDTNGNNDFYDLNGIGKEKAAEIVFDAETRLMDSDTDFADARLTTIAAAEDIFGVNSVEAVAVNNAWYAVGLGNYINGQLIGDECACYNINAVLSATNPSNKTVSWQVSSNLTLVSSNSQTATVKATSQFNLGMGWVKATIEGEVFQKDVWTGKPDQPTSVSGLSSPSYGATINYIGSPTDGATSYQWYLPFPFDPNIVFTINPTQWGILGGGSTTNLNVLVGPNDGLVQVMGVNQCGVGGAKIMSVTVGSGGGSGNGRGGPIPFAPITESDLVKVAPNPASGELKVFISSSKAHQVTLFDSNGNEVFNMTSTPTKNRMDISALSEGLYFLRVVGEVNAVKKVLVKR